MGRSSCFILSSKTCMHCPLIIANACPRCFVNREFRSRQVRQSPQDLAFSSSSNLIGKGVVASKAASLISFCRIARSIVASAFPPVMLAASAAHFASPAMLKHASCAWWQSAWAWWLAMMAAEWVGSCRTTLVLFINLLLMSSPWTVPT